MKKTIILIIIFILTLSGIIGCLETEIEDKITFNINFFIVEPSIINQGEYANLSWNVSGAETVSIDQGIGITSFSGTQKIYPLINTTFTLTANNNSNMLNKTITILVFNNTNGSIEDEPENETNNEQNETIDDNNDDEEDNTTDNNQEEDSNPVAIIYTSLGTIKVKIYLDKLPNTCENFIDLVNDEFYEGLTFHRVKDDFMIQGGTYTLDGIIKDSPYGPISLETHPDILHVDGAISMARSTNPDSATSGFFICNGPQHSLDGEYAAFGVVIEGIEVVQAIASVEHDGSFDPNPGGGEPLESIIIKIITIQD